MCNLCPKFPLLRQSKTPQHCHLSSIILQEICFTMHNKRLNFLLSYPCFDIVVTDSFILWWFQNYLVVRTPLSCPYIKVGATALILFILWALERRGGRERTSEPNRANKKHTFLKSSEMRGLWPNNFENHCLSLTCL